MPDSSISFSKIVPNPTDSKWSQVYSAGSLFTVLSLTRKTNTDADLKSVGKEVLNNLEAEFFTLEEKSLTSIKDASIKSLSSLPTTVHTSFCLGYIKDQVLYLIIAGSGQVVVKRQEKIGIVLKKQLSDPQPDESQLTIESASGRLQNNDIMLLESHAFATLVSASALQEALTNTLPTDIAETLAPTIHEADASAIIISYKEATPLPIDQPVREPSPHHPPREHISEIQEPIRPELKSEQEATDAPVSTKRIRSFSLPKLPALQLPNIRNPRILFAITAILLVLLLIGGVFYTINQREQQKTRALFDEIYASAQKDYDEGVTLLSLNKALARDDFLKAKKTLEDAKPKFKNGSKEEKELVTLLSQINTQLENTSGAASVTATPIAADANPLLAAVQKDKTILAATVYEDDTYLLSKDLVSRIEDGEKADSLVENDDIWTDAVGIGVFGSNIYVLDRAKGVLKLTPAGTTYQASNYFKSTPSMKNAVSMAIDGSVWILMKDGSIQKYTKGETDDFTITGLDTTLAAPIKIVTSETLDHLYVLDPGSQRIVKFDKTGKYQAQFTTAVLKNAREMTITSSEDAAEVVADGKIYSLPLE
jgi:hypothetical protein